MTKQEWLKKSTMAVMLGTSLLMFAEGGLASAAQLDSTAVVNNAYKLVGKPYSSGGNGPSSFDSAGYVSYVLKQMGVQVDDSIAALQKAGTSVSKSNLQPGDILIFRSSSTYVGVYVGNGKFLYSSASKGGVVEQSVAAVEQYLIAARRVSAPTSEATPNTGGSQSSSSTIGQAVIKAGMKYLGTPYEYASSRSTKTTMDCSEFVMWAYREGAGINIGRGGATSQFNYVKEHGTYFYEKSKLKPGDIIWFMKYKGWRESDYKGIDVSSQPIQHNGIYIGDNKVLHTYGSGGVKITQLDGTHWGYRFIKAGRPY